MATPIAPTIAAPVVGSSKVLDATKTDVLVVWPEENRVVILEGATYYLLEKEDRTWLLI